MACAYVGVGVSMFCGATYLDSGDGVVFLDPGIVVLPPVGGWVGLVFGFGQVEQLARRSMPRCRWGLCAAETQTLSLRPGCRPTKGAIDTAQGARAGTGLRGRAWGWSSRTETTESAPFRTCTRGSRPV
eukprot:351714-Amorphochlora_amoeboformis.AAC.1